MKYKDLRPGDVVEREPKSDFGIPGGHATVESVSQPFVGGSGFRRSWYVRVYFVDKHAMPYLMHTEVKVYSRVTP